MMTILYASDHASPPPVGILAAAGIIATNVYVSGRFAQNATHVLDLRDHGIAPWPNYEVGLWELVSDRATGRKAGTVGINDAIRCGFPANGTIWFPFSVDVAITNTADYAKVAEAFRGIQDVNAGRFLISCYGQGDLIRYLRTNSVINQKGWLSASTSFPGYDRNSPHICMWQEFGNYLPGYNTDRNVITDVNSLHAWWPSNSPYGKDPDMPITEAEFDRFGAIVDARIVRALAWLTTGGGNSMVSPGYNIPISDRFPAGTDAYSFAVDPVKKTKTYTLNEIMDAVSKISAGTLTDAQVQAVADAIAAKLPTTITGKLTQ